MIKSALTSDFRSKTRTTLVDVVEEERCVEAPSK